MSTSTFAQAIKQALRSQGLKQSTFAGKVGQSPSNISRICQGKAPPPLDELDTWADRLGLEGGAWRRFVDLGIAANLSGDAQARFLQLCDQHQQFHLQEVRGTMILADQIFFDQRNGKWVIAGTYDHWHSAQDTLHCPTLNLYVRLQLERAGRYPCRLWAVNRNDPPTAPKLWEQHFSLDIDESAIPVFQTHINIPGPTIQAPVKALDREPGQFYALQTSIWLRVGQFEVASCPLSFIFTPPAQETTDEQHPDQPPGSRQ